MGAYRGIVGCNRDSKGTEAGNYNGNTFVQL